MMPTGARVSRRTALAGIGGVAAASILAACGGSTAADADSGEQDCADDGGYRPADRHAGRRRGDVRERVIGRTGSADRANCGGGLGRGGGEPRCGEWSGEARRATAHHPDQRLRLDGPDLRQRTNRGRLLRLAAGVATERAGPVRRPADAREILGCDGQHDRLPTARGREVPRRLDADADAVVWNLKRMVQNPKSFAPNYLLAVDKNNPAQTPRSADRPDEPHTAERRDAQLAQRCARSATPPSSRRRPPTTTARTGSRRMPWAPAPSDSSASPPATSWS